MLDAPSIGEMFDSGHFGMVESSRISLDAYHRIPNFGVISRNTPSICGSACERGGKQSFCAETLTKSRSLHNVRAKSDWNGSDQKWL
ncbi:Hypothetical protein SRAE_1000145850 [Strongyloides ratti]|uniref:Uncharacterized protein n=1 Tax=Strongyloides ratti TaxID=34506 RepID=A0A090L0C7_STRRB|nr:Hypothetical protein SRAE_1000145850 [Strongyloides ratti]CEF63195.1 Hypothetical protein SRAE_1000145850 [Strongyloides ratti]